MRVRAFTEVWTDPISCVRVHLHRMSLSKIPLLLHMHPSFTILWVSMTVAAMTHFSVMKLFLEL